MGQSQRPHLTRLAYLDWMRGIAAVIMLQGHVFHSFAAKGEREGSAYILSQFIGGITPAVFLFLTGVTLAFLMDSRARRGATPLQVWTASLRRSGYFIGIAFLFRMQLWLFAAGQSPWTDLFKVDILNCMALAVLALSPLAALSTRTRARYAALAGVAVAAVSPLIASLQWNRVHPFVKAYLAPDPNAFSFFPWAAFLAFGLSLGSILRVIPHGDLGRFFQWTAVFGIAIWAFGRYAADLPYSLYPQSDFWINSPALIFIKLGILCMMLAAAYLWTTYAAPTGWSWIRQLGSTSLLVYWVHIELVYGRWFGSQKEALPILETVVASVLTVGVMVLLSVLRTGWGSIPPLPSVLRERFGLGQALPSPASGD